MNPQILASYFGLTASPANEGGTDYATSGAKNVTVNDAQTGGFGAAIPSTTQITDYLAANGGRANPNALYLDQLGRKRCQLCAWPDGPRPVSLQSLPLPDLGRR
jgi:hypothetical protein